MATQYLNNIVMPYVEPVTEPNLWAVVLPHVFKETGHEIYQKHHNASFDQQQIACGANRWTEGEVALLLHTALELKNTYICRLPVNNRSAFNTTGFCTF